MSRPDAVAGLPRKVRARLRCQRRIDQFAGWLVSRGHDRMAVLVRKLTGSW